MIPPGTSIGKVRLRVADIDALSEFYERIVGLRGLAERGVIVRAGGALGKPGALRVTYGTPAHNRRFLDALRELV